MFHIYNAICSAYVCYVRFTRYNCLTLYDIHAKVLTMSITPPKNYLGLKIYPSKLYGIDNMRSEAALLVSKANSLLTRLMNLLSYSVN